MSQLPKVARNGCAPSPSAGFFCPTGEVASDVSPAQPVRDPAAVAPAPRRRGPPDLNARAAKHVRHMTSEVRGAITSAAKACIWLPKGDIEIELRLEVRKLDQIRSRLIALRRKLESTERFAGKSEASP